MYDSLVGSLLHHVGSYVCSDVSEEHTTSIFRVTELRSCGYLRDWQDEMAQLYRKVAGIHTFKSKVHTKLSDQNFCLFYHFHNFFFYSPLCHYFTSKVFKTLHFLCFMIITFYFSLVSYLAVHSLIYSLIQIQV